MAILNLLVQLFSGAMLLLFSVRFMRIGIERLWSAQLRSSMRHGISIPQGVIRGTVLGFVMQGATVVMLMAATLAGSGAISISSAAIVALGADLGSALAVGFLQLPVSAVGPFAILVGATLYLRSEQPRVRNFGRVILGLGMIFLSLSIIRATVEPIAGAEFAVSMAAYLSSDPITAALAGIALSLAMHSSVAAILTAIAFSAHATLGPAAALGFVFGCNIGSALLSMWLLKRENERAKTVALSVAALRGAIGVIVIVAVAIFRQPIDAAMPLAAGETMLAGHVGFNVLLIALSPLCRWISRQLEVRLSGKADETSDDAIPPGVVDDVGLATPAIKRRLSIMLDVAAGMLDEVTSSAPDREKMAALERRMNAGLVDIRDIYSKLTAQDEEALKGAQQVLDFAIRLERCGDLLAGKVLDLRLQQVNGHYQFSPKGTEEIAQMVDAVRQSIILAHDTAWTRDAVAAERLVRHKQHVAELEEQSRHKHLSRLREGNPISLASSNQHLEMVAALKEINSKLATIGYVVMEQHGGLKKSRLKSPPPEAA